MCYTSVCLLLWFVTRNSSSRIGEAYTAMVVDNIYLWEKVYETHLTTSNWASHIFFYLLLCPHLHSAVWQGYALIEYESFEEAQAAIRAMNGTQLLTKTVYVDWAFSRGPIKNVMSTRYTFFLWNSTTYRVCMRATLAHWHWIVFSFGHVSVLHIVNHVQNTCCNSRTQKLPCANSGTHFLLCSYFWGLPIV
jgi:hypothetical protein